MSEDYVRRVRAELGQPVADAVQEALDDLRDAVGELDTRDDAVIVSSFGTPGEYAARLREALADDPPDTERPADAQARVVGLPVEARALTDRRVVARMWDPTNPALLVPRLVGAGWTVNLGALAVRLGLLRPDDYDADAVAHIPPAAHTAARAVPLALSAVTCAAIAASWRGLPERIPTSWSATGRVQRTGDRRGLLALAAVGLAALSALAVASALADADLEVGQRGTGAWLLPLLAAVPLAGMLDIALPVRAGLRNLWRKEAGS